MITLVDTELVGRAKREQDPPRRKDRKAAVRYGAGHLDPRRRQPQHGEWAPTLMEAWALDNERFIGASVQDDEAYLLLLPHERPDLVRLGTLAAVPLPGGVLIENLNNLDAPATHRPLARAVLGRYLQRGDTSQNPPLWYGEKWRNNRARARQATAKNIDLWADQAGRSRVKDELDKYTRTVLEQLPEIACFEEDALDFLIYLGSGPLRDKDLAKNEYLRLRAANSDANIARYLETYGYTNPAGTVGRWHHQQLKSLQDSSNM